jgi:hypothetical protein
MYRPRHHGTSLPGVVWGLVLKKAGKGGHTVIIMTWWGLVLKKVGEGSMHRHHRRGTLLPMMLGGD